MVTRKPQIGNNNVIATFPKYQLDGNKNITETETITKTVSWPNTIAKHTQS